jgi:endonuclease III
MKPEKIARILEEYFPNPDIPLDSKDPYTLLIAVLLSAQCTDKRVNQITPLLFKKADTPEKMIRLKPEEIEAIIRPCGLSKAKSKAIWQLSKDLIEKHHSHVPQTMEELMELPGVGRKTASVVLIHAFDVPAFPVDTHIHRCAQRWGLSSGKSVKQTEKELKKLFPEKMWKKLHLQMILFARTYCKARGHDSKKCPICSKDLHARNYQPSISSRKR